MNSIISCGPCCHDTAKSHFSKWTGDVLLSQFSETKYQSKTQLTKTEEQHTGDQGQPTESVQGGSIMSPILDLLETIHSLHSKDLFSSGVYEKEMALI